VSVDSRGKKMSKTTSNARCEHGNLLLGEEKHAPFCETCRAIQLGFVPTNRPINDASVRNVRNALRETPAPIRVKDKKREALQQ
jgi:hypothetical protein